MVLGVGEQSVEAQVDLAAVAHGGVLHHGTQDGEVCLGVKGVVVGGTDVTVCVGFGLGIDGDALVVLGGNGITVLVHEVESTLGSGGILVLVLLLVVEPTVLGIDLVAVVQDVTGGIHILTLLVGLIEDIALNQSGHAVLLLGRGLAVGVGGLDGDLVLVLEHVVTAGRFIIISLIDGLVGIGQIPVPAQHLHALLVGGGQRNHVTLVLGGLVAVVVLDVVQEGLKIQHGADLVDLLIVHIEELLVDHHVGVLADRHVIGDGVDTALDLHTIEQRGGDVGGELLGRGRQLLAQGGEVLLLVVLHVLVVAGQVEDIDLILLGIGILDLGDAVLVEDGLLLGLGSILVFLFLLGLLELLVLGMSGIELSGQGGVVLTLALVSLDVLSQLLGASGLQLDQILGGLDGALQLLVVLVLGAELNNHVGLELSLGDLGEGLVDSLLGLVGGLVLGDDPHGDGLRAVVHGLPLGGGILGLGRAARENAGQQHQYAQGQAYESLVHTGSSLCVPRMRAWYGYAFLYLYILHYFCESVK